VRSDEAKSLLKKNWGIDGEISSLPSERDINFKCSKIFRQRKQGTSYLLFLGRTWYSGRSSGWIYSCER